MKSRREDNSVRWVDVKHHLNSIWESHEAVLWRNPSRLTDYDGLRDLLHGL